jgi:isoleucyl-tRNA synthetase
LASDPVSIDAALANRKVFFLIWTTTPWTLPANLGIAVNPIFEYAAIENGDEVYIVASELAEAVKEKCGLPDANIIARFPGARLDRLECRHAWLDRASLVMLGEHVTLGGEADGETELDVKQARDRKSTAKAGTGCVHTAPGHGHDDFVIGGRYGLPVYCPVDNAGRFIAEVEHFAGERVFEANAKIVEFMRESGALLFAENYGHRYPHCWRCKNPVIFRATPQWFISFDVSEKSADAVPQPTRTKPTKTVARSRTTRKTTANLYTTCVTPRCSKSNARNGFPRGDATVCGTWSRGRPDWCVSRQRVWGVPVPVFYCEGCGKAVADARVINHVAEIFERESADAWYAREARELLPENFACADCGAHEFKKGMDILDVWFDSGSSSIAVLEGRAELQFPADVYLEGGDQYRGWFNSSLMIALAAKDRAPYKTVLTHGWVVDGEGKAMHKSAGNAVRLTT